jgi:hypothetical protein
LRKRCHFCGRFFVPDRRVEERQKACRRDSCKKARKHTSQQAWCQKNPGYFEGRYAYVREWRQKKRQSQSQIIQDKRPPSEPCLKLVLLLPGVKDRMIQDKIVLRRLTGHTFAPHGWQLKLIQDKMDAPQ